MAALTELEGFYVLGECLRMFGEISRRYGEVELQEEMVGFNE